MLDARAATRFFAHRARRIAEAGLHEADRVMEAGNARLIGAERVNLRAGPAALSLRRIFPEGGERRLGPIIADRGGHPGFHCGGPGGV